MHGALRIQTASSQCGLTSSYGARLLPHFKHGDKRSSTKLRSGAKDLGLFKKISTILTKKKVKLVHLEELFGGVCRQMGSRSRAILGEGIEWKEFACLFREISVKNVGNKTPCNFHL